MEWTVWPSNNRGDDVLLSRFWVASYQTHPFHSILYWWTAVPSDPSLYSTQPWSFLLQSSSQCQRISGKSNAIRHASSTHGGLKTRYISQSLADSHPLVGYLQYLDLVLTQVLKGYSCDPPYPHFWSHHVRLQCMSWVSQLPWKLRWSNYSNYPGKNGV